MARYRVILRAAVALALLLPAARQANAQDTLIVDSGGARWKSGENRKPSVTVDFGVIDSLSTDRRRSAFQRQDRRTRRYLTLSIPQPKPPALPDRYDPRVAPVAEAPPEAQTRPPPVHHEPPVAPVAKVQPEAQPPALPDPPELAAVPAATSQPGPQAPPPPPARPDLPVAPAAEMQPEVQPPALPDSPELAAVPDTELQPEAPAKPSVPALSNPVAPAPTASASPAQAAALPVRRTPAGKTEATPALQAFLNRANGKSSAPKRETLSANPLRTTLPPPRPIQPRRTESSAAASTGSDMRFRLPPPAPATGRPGAATPPPAPAAGLPPPPPATGAPESGRLPPPSQPQADMPKPRRLAALDTAAVPVAAAPVVTGHPVTFLYKAGGTILGAEDRARLDSLAARLAGGSALTIEIRAYSGSAESVNVETRREALSRALEVRRLLIAAGVPEARIVARAAGAGEEAGAHVDVVLVGRS